LALSFRSSSALGLIVAVNVCVLLAARCQLDADMGFPCTDYVQRWFFDRTIAACSPFWFGGCGGNANRFSTDDFCIHTVSNGASLHADACLLNQDPGSCQDYTVMWFFDNKQNECQRFWFGGCDGNANRFQTKGDCEKTTSLEDVPAGLSAVCCHGNGSFSPICYLIIWMHTPCWWTGVTDNKKNEIIWKRSTGFMSWCFKESITTRSLKRTGPQHHPSFSVLNSGFHVPFF
uniref:BPTI/Kunitz inhibitor domain-containing protein n=1 Tax=Cyprinodon variegatus TaxID=28743 RepID=A0A3Q2E050_CYPVA